MLCCALHAVHAVPCCALYAVHAVLCLFPALSKLESTKRAVVWCGVAWFSDLHGATLWAVLCHTVLCDLYATSPCCTGSCIQPSHCSLGKLQASALCIHPGIIHSRSRGHTPRFTPHASHPTPTAHPTPHQPQGARHAFLLCCAMQAHLLPLISSWSGTMPTPPAVWPPNPYPLQPPPPPEGGQLASPPLQWPHPAPLMPSTPS